MSVHLSSVIRWQVRYGFKEPAHEFNWLPHLSLQFILRIRPLNPFPWHRCRRSRELGRPPNNLPLADLTCLAVSWYSYLETEGWIDDRCSLFSFICSSESTNSTWWHAQSNIWVVGVNGLKSRKECFNWFLTIYLPCIFKSWTLIWN